MDLTTTLETSQKNDLKYHSKIERNSSIELLRIISMFFIIGHHLSIHSGLQLLDSLDINTIWVKILSVGGKWGVDIFVLISSYFSIDTQFKPKKIIKFILQVTFYAVSIFLILICGGLVSLNDSISFGQALFRTIFNIPYIEYWFATTFFLLFMISPYINRFLKSADETTHRSLILILLIAWSIFPTFFSAQFDFNNLGWFVTLHLIATYIRLYPKKVFENKTLLSILAISNYVLVIILVMDCTTILNRYNTANSTLILISAISTFILFTRLNFKNRVINTISATTFGIYLIHDNQYMRPYLWQIICKNQEYYSTSNFIPHTIVCIIGIFVICSVIEGIRIILLDNLLFKLLESIHIKKNADS